MYTTRQSQDGSFRFIPAVFQYSGGVAAEPGYRIERARFAAPLELAAGFAAVEAHLRALDRPTTALCSFELRSPEPFSEAGFEAFNRTYASQLDAWGLMDGDTNPVARTNVCPELGKPGSVSVHAFSYTVPDTAGGGFVVAGSGEAPEGGASYASGTVRPGDVSPDGLREKAAWVMGEMGRRLAGLGRSWTDACGVHVYTVYEIHPLMTDVLSDITGRGLGLTWVFARPPVAGLDYEMDVRGLPREIVIDGSASR